jgi:REP element-mobilizing transposase RayT
LFVTFNTLDRWVLPESVRGPVLEHCLHDHLIKITVHGVVVMPDHVHMVFSPRHDSAGCFFGLAEIMSGIKGASAHTVNRLLRRTGRVWQDESFDHVARCHEGVEEKVSYLCDNPWRAGLVTRYQKYPWLWREWAEGLTFGQ